MQHAASLSVAEWLVGMVTVVASVVTPSDKVKGDAHGISTVRYGEAAVERTTWMGVFSIRNAHLKSYTIRDN